MATDPKLLHLADNFPSVTLELHTTLPSTTAHLVEHVLGKRVEDLRHRQAKAAEARATRLEKPKQRSTALFTASEQESAERGSLPECGAQDEPLHPSNGTQDEPLPAQNLSTSRGFDYAANYSPLPENVYNAIAVSLIGCAITKPTVKLAEEIQAHIQLHRPEPFDKLPIPTVETIIQVIHQRRGMQKFT